MVFHLSLNDSKSSQVSRTLLRILADLNNALVWIVSARLPISNCSRPCTKPPGSVPIAPITTGITVTLMIHSFFLVLWQGLSTCLSFRLLWFLFCGLSGRQSSLFDCFFFFFFVNYYLVWSSDLDKGICLYLKIPVNFMRLILQDGLWFGRIPFGGIVKFQFLAQFPVDYHPHPVVSSLLLFCASLLHSFIW